MRRAVALVAALALAGTLVFPTVAAPLFEGGDDVGSGVTLAPSDGPNGEYANIAGGELALHFGSGSSGLNPDSVTTFDDVFTVHYSGDQYAEVWLTHGSDAVTFYVDGDPVQSRADSVTLAPSESVAVGVRVDTTGETGGVRLDDITVHSRVAEAASGTLESADLGPAVRSSSAADARRFTVLHAPGGERVTLDTSSLEVARNEAGNVTLESLAVRRSPGGPLSLSVRRVAPSAAGPLPASATVEALGAVEVNVDAGADAVDGATFRFSVARAYLDAAGVEAAELTLYRYSGGEWTELDLSVVGERGDRVLLAGETPGFSTFVLAAERPAIGVARATLESGSVPANASVNVTADVTNTGSARGERTVSVALNGSVVAVQTVSLGPGESTAVTFTVTPGPGEYAVSVGDVAAGTLVVESGSDAGVDDQRSDQRAPGAGEQQQDDATGPFAEPAGIDLSAVLGVGVLLALVLVTLGLARRMPHR